MPRCLLVLVALALASAGLGSCGGGGESGGGESAATGPGSGAEEAAQAAPSGKAQRAVKVRIEGFAYAPRKVVVQEGGKVIWQNEDSIPHTATADDGSFETGPIEEGKIQAETFKEAGTFTYHCSIHPTMHGTVEVVPSA